MSADPWPFCPTPSLGGSDIHFEYGEGTYPVLGTCGPRRS